VGSAILLFRDQGGKAMRFSSGFAKDVNVENALEEAMDAVQKGMEKESISLVFCFFQSTFLDDAHFIATRINQTLNPECLLGCSVAGTIGSDEEVENAPSISLLALSIPEARIQAFYSNQKELEILPEKGLKSRIAPEGLDEHATLLLFPDPYTFDIKSFLDNLNSEIPGLPVLGGLASSSPQNRLILNDQVYEEGTLGCFLDEGIRIQSFVSQGCRPFGEPFIVTESEGNLIRSIAGKPSMEVFQEIYQKASNEDQTLVQQGVFIGMVTDEYKAKPDRGDFLIRSVVGVDQASGALAIADNVEPGQTIQFHVRDKKAAHEDLEYLLKKAKKAEPQVPEGALLFTCNGRGFSLFQVPHHDVKNVQKNVGGCPTAGCFCAGEIGPIAGTNYLHGFSASVALFYPSIK
jgi:small ligand-binding sensory domain FIST